jgi:uncharacterized protein YjbI with pentapeptide repeats
MSNAGISRILGSGIVFLLLVTCPSTPARDFNQWWDRYGRKRALSDLECILEEHKQWVFSEKEYGMRANLSGADLAGLNLGQAMLREADLTGANLQAADLTRADLTNANLEYAQLNGAELIGADLAEVHASGAWLNYADDLPMGSIAPSLPGADLREAKLRNADLKGAHLETANLAGAWLRGADLTAATLDYANLSDANFSEVNLNGARLDGADLARAVFEPLSLPELRGIAAARNLELLTYEDNPDSLAQLRKKFADGGFREQERKITFAMKRREAERYWEKCSSESTPILWSSDSVLTNFCSFILNRGFFDWTCHYGMSPGRPLSLGVLLWVLCSFVYFAFAQVPGSTGLYRVYGQSIHEPSLRPRNAERIVFPQTSKTGGPRRFIQLIWNEWLLLRASMLFSLMSAFNIGFRDINFGRWLRSLTRYEFDIKAVGWARVVAGWQSLISVYLIALWILTYFGRPFG